MSTIKITPIEIEELSQRIEFASAELVNLQNRIIGYLNTLKNLNNSEALQISISKTMESTNHLSELVNQLKLLSQENRDIASSYKAADAEILRDFL
ncbi:MAG: hypothetical protein IJG94_12245 [Clostridia bacterium]|nr:hypothetical protein [Clostridia bacterium]